MNGRNRSRRPQLRVLLLSLLAFAIGVSAALPADAAIRRTRERRTYHRDSSRGFESKTHLLIGGGFSQLNGDAGDVWDSSPGFSAHLAYGVAPFLSLGAGVGFHHFGADEDIEEFAAGELGADEVDFTFNVVPVTADLILGIPVEGSAFPFFSYSVGPYFLEEETSVRNGRVTASSDVDETDLGMNFGGGVSFPLSRSVLFGLGAKYHVVFTDDFQGDVADPDDDTLEFWSLQAGIGISLGN